MTLQRKITTQAIILLVIFATACTIRASAVHVDSVSTKSEAEPKNEAELKHEGNEDESWTDWAKEKITEGLGFKHVPTDEEEAGSKVGEGAKITREKAQNLASDKYEGVKEGAQSTGESTKEQAMYGKDRAANVASESGGYVSDKAGQAKDKVSGSGSYISDVASDVIEKVKGKSSEKGSVAEEKAKLAKEESEKAAEKVKEKASETKEAKEKVKEKAAETMDAAKEKVVGGSNRKEGEL